MFGGERMKLPECWSCSHEYSYLQGLGFLFNRKCPNCREKQYVTTRSNYKSALPAGLLVGVPGFALMFLTDLSYQAYVLVVTGLFILSLLILPFFIETSEKQEPLV
jgi:CXXC-20-CXXC protein